MAVGWLVGGWGLVGVPVLSVQFNRSSSIGPYCRSILSVNTVGPSSRSRRALAAGVGSGRQRVDGWRSWATTRGNSAVAPSMKRQKRLPILKTPGHRAQKPRFCAQNARKRGFRRAKAHKNLDFVLEKPKNEGSKPQKRTKTPILCSKLPKTRVPNTKSAQKPRFCAREEGDWHQGERKSASGSIT